MDNKYICYRCFYETNRKSVITQHLSKKNQCIKNINYYFIHNDILKQSSLMIHNDNEYMCKYCYKYFSKKYNLDRHYEKCKKNKHKCIDIFSKYKFQNDLTVKEVIEKFSVYSLKHYFQKNIIIQPFEKNWCLNHIDLLTKKLLFLSSEKYSDLLIKILENEKNINAVFDKNENMGYILNYSGQFEVISKKIFLEKLLKKLYIILKEFKITLQENDKHIDNVSLKKEDEVIDNKYIYFFRSKELYHRVYHFVFNLYHQKFLETQNNTLYKLNNNNIGY
jgi:hypothetical protein